MAQLFGGNMWDVAVSGEQSPVALHAQLAPEHQTWRTSETLKCLEHLRRAHACLDVMDADATDATRLEGLAELLLGYYHGWGYPIELGKRANPLVLTAWQAILHLNRNAVPVSTPSHSGRKMRAVAMLPGAYALTRSLEIFVQGFMTMEERDLQCQQRMVESSLRMGQAFMQRMEEPLSPDVTWGLAADVQLQEQFGCTTLHCKTCLLWSNILLCKHATGLPNNLLAIMGANKMVTLAQQLLELQPNMPMAHFFYAEGLHMRDGPTQQTLAEMRRAVQASQSQGDEVYGALSACYACLLLVCGKKPYSKREVDGLLAQVEVFKEQLKRTGRWHNMMRKRCTIILEPVKKHFKAALKQANVSADSNEDAKLRPYTGQIEYGVQTEAAEAHLCAGCNKLYHTTFLCSGCRAVRYCSRACQLDHRPQHKAACKAASADKAKSSSPSKAAAKAASSSPGDAGPSASAPAASSTSAGAGPSASVQATPESGAGPVDAASVAMMSVRELKAAMAALGVSTSGCLERADLVARLLAGKGDVAKHQ